MTTPKELALKGGIGICGTLLAKMTPDLAAIFAGVATGLWMLWQLATSIYDRCKKR